MKVNQCIRTLKLIAKGLPFFLFVNCVNLVKAGDVNISAMNVYIDPAVADANSILKQIPSSENSFQFFSHGRPGELYLKGSWQTKEEIVRFLRPILSKQIKHVNIYACSFAKGEKGREALQYLEQQLAVSFAASTNITGNGGDWVLEEGKPVEALSFPNYTATLQCPNFGTGDAQDYDCDGVINSMDQDDDNDGILDKVECVPSSFVAITPSDFKFNATTAGTNSASNIDLSSKFSLPSGSIIVSVVNASVNSDKTLFFVGSLNRSNKLTFTITGSVPVKIRSAHGAELAIGASDYFEALDNVAYTMTSPINNSDIMPYNTGSVYGVSNRSKDVVNNGVVFAWESVSAASMLKFSSTTATINNAVFLWLYPLIDCDLDKDGIPNGFDLDSDADSCPDALEGSGTFSVGNMVNSGLPGGSTNIDDNLGNSIDTNAVPKMAKGGQGKGSAYDSTVRSEACNTCIPVYPCYTGPGNIAPPNNTTTLQCPNFGTGDAQDYDCDGVINSMDQDDDNDGILDKVECVPSSFVAITPSDFKFNATTAGTNSASNIDLSSKFSLPSGSIIVSVVNASVNSDKTLFFVGSLNRSNKLTFTITGSVPVKIRSAHGAELAIGASDYFEALDNVAYTMTSPINNSDIMPYNTGSVYGVSNRSKDVVNNGVVFVWESVSAASMLKFSSTTATINNAVFLWLYPLIDCDLDKDGIPNGFDLDSDADSCPDALEGSGTFSVGNMVNSGLPGGSTNIDDNLGNSIDTNAVPKMAKGGQGKGSAYDSTVRSEACTFCIPVYPRNMNFLRRSSVPVEKLILTAQKDGSGRLSLLQWTTDQETNNDHFVVERSADGLHFTDLEKQFGKGNLILTSGNGETDHTPLSGKNYYRLRSVNKDGKTKYSNTQLLVFDKVSKGYFATYPNPISYGRTTVQITGKDFGSIRMYNANGQLLYILVEKNNVVNYNISVQNLAKGIYFLHPAKGETQKLLVH